MGAGVGDSVGAAVGLDVGVDVSVAGPAPVGAVVGPAQGPWIACSTAVVLIMTNRLKPVRYCSTWLLALC